MENNRKPPMPGSYYPPFSAGLVGDVQHDAYAAMLKAQESAEQTEEDRQAAAEAKDDAVSAKDQAISANAAAQTAKTDAAASASAAASSAASVAASAAQIETNKKEIGDIKNDLVNGNAYNLIDVYGSRTERTHRNVTFAWTGSDTFTVKTPDGETSTDAANGNSIFYIQDGESFPAYLQPGESYYVDFLADNVPEIGRVFLQAVEIYGSTSRNIYFPPASTPIEDSKLVYRGVYTIPQDVTGFILRLRSSGSGVSYNVSGYARFRNTKTNAELTSDVDNLSSEIVALDSSIDDVASDVSVIKDKLAGGGIRPVHLQTSDVYPLGFTYGAFRPETAESTTTRNLVRTFAPVDFGGDTRVTVVNNSNNEIRIQAFSDVPNFANGANNSAIYVAEKSHIGVAGESYTFDADPALLYYISLYVAFDSLTAADVPTITVKTDLWDVLEQKVDKVEGKELSSNDFTDGDKADIQSLKLDTSLGDQLVEYKTTDTYPLGFRSGTFNPETALSFTTTNYIRTNSEIEVAGFSNVVVKNNSTEELRVYAFTDIPSFTNQADNSAIYDVTKSYAGYRDYSFKPVSGYHYYVSLHIAWNDGNVSDDDLPTVIGVLKIQAALDEKVDKEDAFKTKTVPVFRDKEEQLITAITNDRGSDSIVICVAADNHYNSFDFMDCLQPYYAVNMSHIAKKLNADFIVDLGDIAEGYNDYIPVSDYTQQYVNSQRLLEMFNAYTIDDIPFFYVAGHHEAMPIDEVANASATLNDGVPFVQNRALYSSELKAMAFGTGALYRQRLGSLSRVGYRRLAGKITDIADPNSNTSTQNKTGASITYYLDYSSPSGKTVRFLMVDGTFFTVQGYDPDTVTFVSDCLNDAHTKNLPVIIFTHMPLRREYYSEGRRLGEAWNESAFISAIKDSGAYILAYIHGHTHIDNIVTPSTQNEAGQTPYSDLTFPQVAISCQKIYGGAADPAPGHTYPFIQGEGYATYGTRDVATYSGYCFDTIIVNANTGKIDFYRFGAGDNGTYPTRTVNG